jgi:hypothetical protein
MIIVTVTTVNLSEIEIVERQCVFHTFGGNEPVQKRRAEDRLESEG